ncbi:Tellurite resistance protein TehB [Amphritea atlantica]|uniref:Tellurite resistance protein TehB n=1 Tax=Amphritea atlantica TaxID=355243 RepID=A0A1H9II00_9GAMM|nr:methyltransferase domain-containing protein [Amphritea atlantica]SEQ73995.1 Tellurite resistance protein TehB [Amphritea atlantica]
MSRADLWNKRYLNKTDTAPVLPAELQRQLDSLAPGHTLDLACGDGAAALYLASAGHQLMAVDFAERGLRRLQQFAADHSVTVESHRCDLNNPDELRGLGRFDNIVIVRYLPERLLLNMLPDLMKPGAHLLITTFNQEHHLQSGFPLRFCLQPQQLIDQLPRLTLVCYDNGLLKGSVFDSYLFTL